MLLVQLLQTLSEALVAGMALEHGQGLGGRLAIGAQEGDAVAVAGGVDTHTDTVQRTGLGHRELSTQLRGRQLGSRPIVSSVAREPVSLLQEIFGQAILVISGQGRMMYQNF